MISSERVSDRPLLLNSCGIEHFEGNRADCLRQGGRADYHLLYIAAGEGWVRSGDRLLRAEEGSVVLFRPYERQEYFVTGDPPSVSYYLHFTGKECRPLLEELGLWNITLYPMGRSEELETLFPTLLMEHSFKKTAYEPYCAALLLQLLTIVARGCSGIKRQEKRMEERILPALELMHRELHRELTAEELAAACCLSVGHMEHLFRSAVGVAPHAYLITLRLERAKELLLDSDSSVAQIGRSIGFCDQNYFSRFFKSRVGLSPSEYRNRYRM